MSLTMSRRMGVVMGLLFALGAVSPSLVNAQSKKQTQTTDEKAVAVGDKAPDFSLESMGKDPVVLSKRFGKEGKPVILLFSRANW